MALDKIIYTAHATAQGGRDGVGKTNDDKLSVKLNPPKEMGGNGDGTNPEQLFAVGYSACFLGAMHFVAGTHKIKLPADTSVNGQVHFGPRANGAKGFSVDVALAITAPGMARAELEKIVHEAHEVCPYSNATRGNIDVHLSVV